MVQGSVLSPKVRQHLDRRKMLFSFAQLSLNTAINTVSGDTGVLLRSSEQRTSTSILQSTAAGLCLRQINQHDLREAHRSRYLFDWSLCHFLKGGFAPTLMVVIRPCAAADVSLSRISIPNVDRALTDLTIVSRYTPSKYTFAAHSIVTYKTCACFFSN
jgi:hypothetical protein